MSKSTTNSSGGLLDDIRDLASSVDIPSPMDDAVTSLEARLQQEMDSRKEERFYWVLVTCVLANVVSGIALKDTTISLMLFVFQIPVLIRLAIRSGMEDVAIPWEYLISKYMKNKDPD